MDSPATALTQCPTYRMGYLFLVGTACSEYGDRMTRHMKATARSAIALAAASTLLAGCFTIEATFTIKDDATADIDYLIVFDTEQLQELSGMLGEDAGAVDELSSDALLDEILGGDDPCGDLTTGLTDYDVSVRDIDENGEVGVGCTVSGVPIAELTSLGDDTSSFSIEQDAGVTRFDAVLEGVDELAGDPAETDAMTEMLGLDLDELITIKFTVTAPGSLGENNASSTSGSTATWDVKADSDFVANGDATMTAQWNPGGGGGGGSSTWIIIAIVAAVVAAAAIAFVLFKRSKGTPDEMAAPAATDLPVAPPGFAPDTPGATPPPPPMTAPEAPTSPSAPPPPPPPAAPEPPTAPTSTPPPPPPPS
jgi:hypothetical protein